MKKTFKATRFEYMLGLYIRYALTYTTFVLLLPFYLVWTYKKEILVTIIVMAAILVLHAIPEYLTGLIFG